MRAVKCQSHGCDAAAKWAGPADNEGRETTVLACDEHRMDGDVPVNDEMAAKAAEDIDA